MLDFISQMTGKAAKAVKNWWLLLVAGLLGIAAGIAVFVSQLTAIMFSALCSESSCSLLASQNSPWQ